MKHGTAPPARIRVNSLRCGMAFGSVYSDCRLPATGPRISQHPAPLDLPCGVRARNRASRARTRMPLRGSAFSTFITMYSTHAHELRIRGANHQANNNSCTRCIVKGAFSLCINANRRGIAPGEAVPPLGRGRVAGWRRLATSPRALRCRLPHAARRLAVAVGWASWWASWRRAASPPRSLPRL